LNLSVRLSAAANDSIVAVVVGELDLLSAELLDGVLSPLPSRGIRHLIIDARRLRFCDVCGYRALITLHAMFVAVGGGLTIADPRPALRRLMDLLNVEALRMPVPTCTTSNLAAHGNGRRARSLHVRCNNETS
jgi:anti-anti-sigma factor